MAKPTKKKYLSILCYYFYDPSLLNDNILTDILYKYYQNDDKLISSKIKALQTIFNHIMLKLLKHDQILQDNNYNNYNESKDKIQHYFGYYEEEERKLKQWLTNTKIGDNTLKKCIERLIQKCVKICQGPNGKKKFDAKLHSKVLIQFAKKLINNINSINSINQQDIIHTIFTDIVSSEKKENDDGFNKIFALKRLQSLLYQMYPKYFDSNSNKNMRNLHIIFVPKPNCFDDNKEQEEEEEEAKENEDTINIHLMNISIIYGMSVKQIIQFILINLKNKYQKYRDDFKYDDIKTANHMICKIWNNKISEWNMIKNIDNYDFCLNNNGNDDKSTTLLISDGNNFDDKLLSFNKILTYIHRYSLMTLSRNEDIYYYDDNYWKNGKITEIHKDYKKNEITMIQINNDKYLFNTNADDYDTLMPYKLLNWFPSTHFAKQIPSCCKPKFIFISSFILSPSNPQLFIGNIHYHDQYKFSGVLQNIDGNIPYPFDDKIINIMSKREIYIKSKLNLESFIKQNGKFLSDDNIDCPLHVWSKFKNEKQLIQFHQFLTSDLEHVQIVQNNQCTLYFLTMQHLEKLKKIILRIKHVELVLIFYSILIIKRLKMIVFV